MNKSFECFKLIGYIIRYNKLQRKCTEYNFIIHNNKDDIIENEKRTRCMINISEHINKLGYLIKEQAKIINIEVKKDLITYDIDKDGVKYRHFMYYFA